MHSAEKKIYDINDCFVFRDILPGEAMQAVRILSLIHI